MKIVSRRKRLWDKTNGFLNHYLVLNLALLAALFLVRVCEYFYVGSKISLPPNGLSSEMFGFGRDFIIWLNISGILILPAYVLYLFFRRISYIITGLLMILFLMLELALIEYFAVTSLLLGADFFGYTTEEIVKIVSAGQAFNFKSLIPFLLTISFFVGITLVFQRYYFRLRYRLLFVILSVGSLLFNASAFPSRSNSKSEMNFSLETNKAFHFLDATKNFYLPSEPSEAALSPYFYLRQFTKSNSFEYLSDLYPFLHRDKTTDVLGTFMKKSDRRPDVVLILVESLGRAYSGQGARLKSFTPFLDSLQNHSLYWENMVSTAGRTFEVLPSVLGSLPYGKNGFAEMGNQMPDAFSLISIMRKNGYKTRFFYGGDSRFDNMKLFLENQKVEELMDESSFESGYQKMPATSDNFSWGYGDDDLFRKGIDYLKKSDPSNPSLNIFLTLAMHDPYRILNQDYYNQKAEAWFAKMDLPEDVKNEYRKYLPNFSTVLYFNDAIAAFFKAYQRLPNYENTIFLITGDHRMSTPPIATQIDRFHVPLLVYSPLLTKARKFSSVVSHLDITPSLVAYLKSHHGLKAPGFVPWLGQGLDSVTTFRSTLSIPFIRTKSETIDYLDGNDFLSNGQLFVVGEHLDLSPGSRADKMQLLNQKLEKFNADNIKACYNNRLIPDSLKIWNDFLRR